MAQELLPLATAFKPLAVLIWKNAIDVKRLCRRVSARVRTDTTRFSAFSISLVRWNTYPVAQNLIVSEL
jgi:hypothetical protein